MPARPGVAIEEIGELRRSRDERLHVRVLAVQYPQRIRCETPLRVRVELVDVLSEIVDERISVLQALVRIAYRIDLQRHASELESRPQPCQHDDLLGVDVRTGEAQ